MMSRRNWLVGGVAVGALAAGAWVNHRRLGLAELPTATSGTSGSAELQRFWQLEFETPSGAQLATKGLQGRPLVLNFWATWCPPCIKEMPELDRFVHQFGGAGWQVLGLAIDQKAPVQQFLQRSPVSFPTALAGPDGLALVRELGNPAGGLPFTVVFSSAGEIVQRKLGPTDFAELSGWAAARGAAG